MKAVYNRGNLTITMTADQARIIEYALGTGTEKLHSTALFMKHLKMKGAKEESRIAKRTADKATKAQKALREAIRKAFLEVR